MELYAHQQAALDKIHNGCILVGEPGAGKSLTAIAYFYTKICGGDIFGASSFSVLPDPTELVIITTAKKRDDHDWEKECAHFYLSTNILESVSGVHVTIDSWNNIKKYKDKFGCFFIFDEQRVVGSGPWVKAFLRIAARNKWILLSATPGDTWKDYIPVFVANGFYQNKTQLLRRHAVFSRYAKYPKVERWVEEGVLLRCKAAVIVDMNFHKDTQQIHSDIWCDYDRALYKKVWRDRWDPYDNEPIQETGKLFYLMRKVVNTDASRIGAVRRILEKHDRVIIFYSYTCELEIIRSFADGAFIDLGEWNGQVHSPVPGSRRWIYAVQYSAGAEGWNCTSTDAMIFFSQSYSYKQMIQAAGRIDRLNTTYHDLYYYHLVSHSPIDLAIKKALSQKKDFNEKRFLGKKVR